MPALPTRRHLIALGLALPLAVAPAVVRAGSDVTVFAAASLKTVLDRIAAAFESFGGGPVHLSYGGSSALARQIQFGAEADLFLSASRDWMDVLEADGMLAPGARRDLLTNRLVLIAPADRAGDLSLVPGADLAGALGDDGLLAMALVDAVPAGQYGRAALGALGLWDSVAARVVQTDHVRAALRLVAIGEAALGIVYATDAMVEPAVRVLGTFPPDSHPPIRYPVALLRDADRPETRAFLDYLTGPEARAVFDAAGFGRP